MRDERTSEQPSNQSIKTKSTLRVAATGKNSNVTLAFEAISGDLRMHFGICRNIITHR